MTASRAETKPPQLVANEKRAGRLGAGGVSLIDFPYETSDYSTPAPTIASRLWLFFPCASKDVPHIIRDLAMRLPVAFKVLQRLEEFLLLKGRFIRR